MRNKLICLDRDGIINSLCVDQISGEIDSPMSMSDITVYPWASQCLKQLNDLGFSIAICTNQPAPSKGLNSKEKIMEIHNHILKVACSDGARIGSSHLCFHRAADDCECRKPKTGMIKQAWLNSFDKTKSLFVGDMWSDVIAGHTFGLNTALINSDTKSMQMLEERNIVPTFIGANLKDLVNVLKDRND